MGGLLLLPWRIPVRTTFLTNCVRNLHEFSHPNLPLVAPFDLHLIGVQAIPAVDIFATFKSTR